MFMNVYINGENKVYFEKSRSNKEEKLSKDLSDSKPVSCNKNINQSSGSEKKDDIRIL